MNKEKLKHVIDEVRDISIEGFSDLTFDIEIGFEDDKEEEVCTFFTIGIHSDELEILTKNGYTYHISTPDYHMDTFKEVDENVIKEFFEDTPYKKCDKCGIYKDIIQVTIHEEDLK